MRYKVYLKFIYSDVVEVEAGSRAEAESLALEQSQEEYESFYDVDVEELEDD